MALMKTGRKGEDPTKKKGVEPTKAQSEVKVTAKRPVEPKKYSFEEYRKNEEIKASNKAKREKYDSDMASYNKAMNLYTSGGTPTASESELSLLKGSKVGDKKATFSSNKDILSAARENEMYEKGLKSGEYVDIDDPRIDAKTKYFLKGATKGLTSGGDILGEKTGKISVPYEMALGKSKPTKWADVYGGKDFDPYEFEKASKSGKLDQYMNKKGMRPGDLAVSEVGARTEYKKVKKVDQPIYEKESNIDFSSVDRSTLPELTKMELKKPKIETERGEIVRPKKEEKAAPTFEEPTGGIKKRTKYSLPQTTSRGNKTLSGVAVNLGRFVKAKAEAIGKDNALTPKLNKTEGKARLIQGKTGREAKEFKAYYGAPSSTSGETTYGMTAPEIAQERENLKTVKKQLRADIKKGGDVSKSELRSEIRNIRKDIRSTNKAEKYASKNIEARSVYPDGKERVIVQEKKDNQNKAYKGDDLGRQYYEYSKYQQFKKSTDNPANKNTIANQEKSLSFKEKVQQSKQNNIKRREERKNAPTFSEKRQQRIADKQTMKRADEMVKKIK
jgi:hypothetical protein